MVTAALNEEATIGRLLSRLREVVGEAEVIVVDGGSTDRTREIASRLADRVLVVPGGQTAALYAGIAAASGDVVVTIDADLENPPELVPELVEALEESGSDVVVASRTRVPRLAERLASATLGRLVGVSDLFSNFRAYRRASVLPCRPRLGETFGGELLACVRARGGRVAQVLYEPPPRRARPRIGGTLRANLRALLAAAKLLLAYGPALLARSLCGRARGPPPRSLGGPPGAPRGSSPPVTTNARRPG